MANALFSRRAMPSRCGSPVVCVGSVVYDLVFLCIYKQNEYSGPGRQIVLYFFPGRDII